LRHRSITTGSTALGAALLLLAAASWLVAGVRMHGMDMGPGTNPGTLGFYVVTWVVMMTAMMLPSVLPMVTGYSRLERAARDRGRVGSITAFVAGYLVVWTVFGLVAYGVFEGVRHLSIGWLNWSRGGRWIAVVVLLAGAAYQLSPAKHACLRRCRATIPFLTREWRDGRLGALRMGTIHGAWCSGCCWALMVALFALGLMSLTWMALVAAAVAAEKLLPWPRITAHTVAVLLVALGVGVALTPTNVPGLTVPGSHAMPRTTMQQPAS
jgi:predicted metal-binding membrane protein